MTTRPNKDNYYLNIAMEVSKRSTCLRRNYGCVIVNRDQIISTGYAGAPRGRKNCIDLMVCPRKRANIPRGERYELCRSVHAEMNAIIHASREEMIGGVLYLCGTDFETGEEIYDVRPCKMCTRMIINAGIVKVIVRESQKMIKTYSVSNWIDEEEVDYDEENISGY